MWSTPWSRATSIVRSVEPSSITSHSTSSKPATARGRSASVAGSVASSLRQGIWMMSFMPAVAPVSHMARATLPAAARPWAWRIAVAAVLAVALVLRLWGLEHGLPYVYNADENAHFVPNAIGLFGHGFNPHYFVNPPAFTYLLHVVFALRFGGARRRRPRVRHRSERGPRRRARDERRARHGRRRARLPRRRAARRTARSACSRRRCWPSPSCPSSTGTSRSTTARRSPRSRSRSGAPRGSLRGGRAGDYALAGVGLGLACATKYTALVALAPLLGAAVGRPGGARGLLVAGAAAVAAFVAADPFAVLAPRELHGGLAHQLSATGDAEGKLGLTQASGHLYYLWTLTWGLGWVPLAAAVAGGVLVARRDRAAARSSSRPRRSCSCSCMGLQGRFFGRWLLPVFPILCLLAALAVAALAGRRRPAPALVALVLWPRACSRASTATGCCRGRTRATSPARGWSTHVPAGTRVVVEPIVPGRVGERRRPRPAARATAPAGASGARCARICRAGAS